MSELGDGLFVDLLPCLVCLPGEAGVLVVGVEARAFGVVDGLGKSVDAVTIGPEAWDEDVCEKLLFWAEGDEATMAAMGLFEIPFVSWALVSHVPAPLAGLSPGGDLRWSIDWRAWSEVSRRCCARVLRKRSGILGGRTAERC